MHFTFDKGRYCDPCRPRPYSNIRPGPIFGGQVTIARGSNMGQN